MLVAFLREQHLVPLLVDPVVAGPLLLGLAGELRHELVQPVVEVDVVVGLAGDDQRRPRLVDQDRVDLVDDRVAEAALDPLPRLEHHVVAQVVEAVLVVRAVGDVGAVGDLLRVVLHVREVDPDGEPEEAVDAPHPVGVALREVVVDGDDVDALAGQRVEVRRERGDQRLALAGAHFGDLAVVQRDAADQLHVEVPHLQRPLAGLADHGERLGQDRVEGLAVGDPRLELVGLGPQRLVRQRGHRGLESVDRLDGVRVLLEQPLVATAEDAREDVGDHEGFIFCRRAKKQGVRTASPLLPSRPPARRPAFSSRIAGTAQDSAGRRSA